MTQLDQTPSKNPEKRSTRRARSSPQMGFPRALRILAPLETRERVLATLKASGFPPDTWGSRASLEALADALTRAEDWLELQRSTPRRDSERESLRGLRRALEQELYP